MIKFLIIIFIGLSLIPLTPFAYSEYVKWDAQNPADDESTLNMFLDAATPKSVAALARQTQEINSTIVIIDMRSEEEYEREHAKDAIPIQQMNLMGEIVEKVSDKERAIYVYGTKENNAAVAVRLLRNMGYSKSFVLEGGLKAWKNAGYPTEEYYY